jgi:phage shock protein A
MGLLARLKLVVKSRLQAFTASAEDPRKTFAYAYQRQRELLTKVQQALVDIAASKKQLEAKTAETRERLPPLAEQARRALLAGHEDLARSALQRRQVAAVALQTLEEQVHEVAQEEDRLSLIEQRLTTQIEAFHTRHEVIAARYSAAEAQVRINEALTGVSEELSDLGVALEQAEQRARYMQARATAIDQLIETGALEVSGVAASDRIEQQLSQPDIIKAVEDQLGVLKRALKKQ